MLYPKGTTRPGPTTVKPTSIPTKAPPVTPEGDYAYGAREMVLAAVAGCLATLALAAIVMGAIATRKPSPVVPITLDPPRSPGPQPGTSSELLPVNRNEPLQHNAAEPVGITEQSRVTGVTERTEIAEPAELRDLPSETITNQEILSMKREMETKGSSSETRDDKADTSSLISREKLQPTPSQPADATQTGSSS